jgi:hypothetical protein
MSGFIHTRCVRFAFLNKNALLPYRPEAATSGFGFGPALSPAAAQRRTACPGLPPAGETEKGENQIPRQLAGVLQHLAAAG